MRLAGTPGPAALLERLFQIDATRAPLHPLVLQVWLRLFGTTEASARALSVLCGVVTVGLVWWIGKLVFDAHTGLWAACLASVSPLLVYYSREARMYAWLVMVTSLCWGLLFALRRAARPRGRDPREGEAPAERSCTPPSRNPWPQPPSASSPASPRGGFVSHRADGSKSFKAIAFPATRWLCFAGFLSLSLPFLVLNLRIAKEPAALRTIEHCAPRSPGMGSGRGIRNGRPCRMSGSSRGRGRRGAVSPDDRRVPPAACRPRRAVAVRRGPGEGRRCPGRSGRLDRGLQALVAEPSLNATRARPNEPRSSIPLEPSEPWS
jgi:Dolichyl-phosphate-mannose-protein mannosyltransferase